MWSPFRQQPFAPRMIPRRLDGAVRERDRGGSRHVHRTRGDGLVGERLALMGDAQRSVHPFFHQHLRSPDVGLDLIELPVVRPRPLTAHDQ